MRAAASNGVAHGPGSVPLVSPGTPRSDEKKRRKQCARWRIDPMELLLRLCASAGSVRRGNGTEEPTAAESARCVYTATHDAPPLMRADGVQRSFVLSGQPLNDPEHQHEDARRRAPRIALHEDDASVSSRMHFFLIRHDSPSQQTKTTTHTLIL